MDKWQQRDIDEEMEFKDRLDGYRYNILNFSVLADFYIKSLSNMYQKIGVQPRDYVGLYDEIFKILYQTEKELINAISAVDINEYLLVQSIIERREYLEEVKEMSWKIY